MKERNAPDPLGDRTDSQEVIYLLWAPFSPPPFPWAIPRLEADNVSFVAIPVWVKIAFSQKAAARSLSYTWSDWH